MQINLSYFVVYKSHILSLSNEETLAQFMAWYRDNANPIRMPWGDIVYSLESFVTEEEDFDLQEEVFSDCPLEIQNLIYKLKKIQLSENPDNQAELVFER